MSRGVVKSLAGPPAQHRLPSHSESFFRAGGFSDGMAGAQGAAPQVFSGPYDKYCTRNNNLAIFGVAFQAAKGRKLPDYLRVFPALTDGRDAA